MSDGGMDVAATTGAPLNLVLLNFAEWLDVNGLIVAVDDTDDDRTHEQLVHDYLVEMIGCG